ncbi:AT-hook motif nuclear-localized protein 17-like [Cucurbita moschata]|uniref:AT-hook motif nuclear-localized protein 17-like n=1 Tax=Cucurbita moschata TaxID=3662 RepID=A0A6J1FL04_CUCMO|nr:AT-hook motif nuclear-localized protein 17-like [Cucurbita moschata]
MFPKPHHQPPPHFQPFPRSFAVAATPPPRDSSTAADDDSTTGHSPLTHAMLPKEPASGGDGASIEVVRRPRGRPPGSKNKPKPAAVVVAARDAEPAMSPYVLEVPGGSDIVEAISRFCRRRNTGLCVLNAYGTVADVTLRQPSSSPVATVTFHGRFDILSVCATFVPHTTSFPIPNGFTITLAGPQGQIFGGLVAGALIGAGTVFIIAASFNNPSYQRLPSEDEVRKSGFSDVEEGHSPPISGGKDSENTNAAADTCGLLPMYSTHSSSDAIWSRQPAAPPHHRQY